MADIKDDFFTDETGGTNTETQGQGETQETKIKVGDKEYTQDELNKYVGLGQTASELETKWNTKIDKLYPEFTKKTQQLAELETRAKEWEQKELTEAQTKVQQGQEVSPEERKRLVLQEAEQYGLVHAGNVGKFISDYLAGRDLLGEIDSIIEDASENGKPVINKGDLLTYMDENGIKSPEAAYKLKFEKELDAWKEKQKETLKGSKFETEETSSVGFKVPPDVKITRENLLELTRGVLRGE